MGKAPSNQDTEDNCNAHIAEVQIAKIRWLSKMWGRPRFKGQPPGPPPDPVEIAKRLQAYRDRYAKALPFVEANCPEAFKRTLRGLEPPPKPPRSFREWLKDNKPW